MAANGNASLIVPSCSAASLAILPPAPLNSQFSILNSHSRRHNLITETIQTQANLSSAWDGLHTHCTILAALHCTMAALYSGRTVRWPHNTVAALYAGHIVRWPLYDGRTIQWPRSRLSLGHGVYRTTATTGLRGRAV